MYEGEVKVNQRDLASLIEAAECLCIKDFAFPDVDPSPSVTSKSQPSFSNISNFTYINNTSENINVTDISSCHDPSPPRKRQRKESGENETMNSKAKENNLLSYEKESDSVPVQQNSSFVEQKSPEKNDNEPDTPPVNQIKTESDIQYQGGPSNFYDEEPKHQSVLDIGYQDGGMTDTNELVEDYPSFTEIDIEKEELDSCNEEDWIDSVGIGPYRLQEVS